jgi:exonuclease VII small subunit
MKKPYNLSYAKLNRAAERLRNGGPDDIDTLMETFKEGREGYAECRERLDEIRREIESEIARTGRAIGGDDPFAAA